MSEKQSEKIKNYWDERARQNMDVPTATTDDVHLRRLEITTITDALNLLDLPEDASVLDVGCGDGFSTLMVAQAWTRGRFLGVDYSPGMIKNALRRLQQIPALQDRVAFSVGDATNLEMACGSQTFDVALSDRCLINLESSDDQATAIAEIAGRLKRGGYYIAIENFIEGQNNLSSARRAVGLEEIPIRWHNLLFTEEQWRQCAEPFFNLMEFKDFSSSYYFATRVIYSAMCRMRGEKPDYEHEIHQLAVDLPWSGQFSPIRMAVMRRR